MDVTERNNANEQAQYSRQEDDITSQQSYIEVSLLRVWFFLYACPLLLVQLRLVFRFMGKLSPRMTELGSHCSLNIDGCDNADKQAQYMTKDWV